MKAKPKPVLTITITVTMPESTPLDFVQGDIEDATEDLLEFLETEGPLSLPARSDITHKYWSWAITSLAPKR